LNEGFQNGESTQFPHSWWTYIPTMARLTGIFFCIFILS
jgi:hypothetical protein